MTLYAIIKELRREQFIHAIVYFTFEGSHYEIPYTSTSAALFNMSYFSLFVHSSISFMIHAHHGALTLFIASILPSNICECKEPLDPLITWPAYYA